jgi:ABC-2 type transport system permease protein
MNRFLATLIKELLLLRRDRAGLAVLFIMPAVLVLVITLVQQHALSTIGEGRTSILFIDGDQDALGRLIHEALLTAPGVDLTVRPDGDAAVLEAALESVIQGEYQLYLRLPPGTTQRVRARAKLLAKQAFEGEGQPGDIKPPPAAIELHFDPTVLGSLRSAVHHLLELMLLRLEVAEKVAALGEELPAALAVAMKEALGPMAAVSESLPTPGLALSWPAPALLQIAAVQTEDRMPLPTATQHNVPAWSLFGIFFIVLPMAGTFIKERYSGVALRLRSLPVVYPTLMAGKVGAYILVCLGQLVLIVSIGKWVLPLCGATAFTLDAAPLALVLVTACVILAATSLGILLGTVVGTYEQAAMVGPISIVIAAAIGGVMVPVYAMPTVMQRLSLLSPLAWGLNAYIELFVRQGHLADVAPEAAALALFAMACLLLAWGVRYGRQRSGRTGG